jgi:hypothetical protein
VTESNEQLFTVVFDLPESQLTALLGHCRETQRPVQEVAKAAIADYLARTAPELEKVLSVD